MPTFKPAHPDDLAKIKRLCLHQDHLKGLCKDYEFMRRQGTYDPMLDLTFRCDPQQMDKLDQSFFTSLIIKLPRKDCQGLFDELKKAYDGVDQLVKEYHPEAEANAYFDSAHITLKSILDFKKQNQDDLKKYVPIISKCIQGSIDFLSSDTVLYGMGLFCNLHENKGLSIGVKFFPSHPMVQIIRGEVGVALYNAVEHESLASGTMRDEQKFHTRLTHSTGYRARNFSFPLHPVFIQEFVKTIDKFDENVFGSISDISLKDVFIRNGKSDKLTVEENGEIVGEELCIADHL
ncbi:MAG: hypothetical protein KAU41_11645 [Deltaproteobacteria bacterium]|nr:hypothetical protein [Deltaproteobacteria bacterium]